MMRAVQTRETPEGKNKHKQAANEKSHRERPFPLVAITFWELHTLQVSSSVISIVSVNNFAPCSTITLRTGREVTRLGGVGDFACIFISMKTDEEGDGAFGGGVQGFSGKRAWSHVNQSEISSLSRVKAGRKNQERSKLNGQLTATVIGSAAHTPAPNPQNLKEASPALPQLVCAFTSSSVSKIHRSHKFCSYIWSGVPQGYVMSSPSPFMDVQPNIMGFKASGKSVALSCSRKIQGLIYSGLSYSAS